MVNKFRDPILTPLETARHLRINERTLYRWLHEKAAGEPLVHAVEAEKRGGPSVPFVAVVEAYVLHALRDLGLSLHKIREAAEAVRREFGEPYGLATRRIATDGVEIFVDHAGDLARARDGQRPIREVIEDYLRYITWEADGRTPQRLRLMQYPDVAPVIIDPRFGWGRQWLRPTRFRWMRSSASGRRASRWRSSATSSGWRRYRTGPARSRPRPSGGS